MLVLNASPSHRAIFHVFCFSVFFLFFFVDQRRAADAGRADAGRAQLGAATVDGAHRLRPRPPGGPCRRRHAPLRSGRFRPRATTAPHWRSRAQTFENGSGRRLKKRRLTANRSQKIANIEKKVHTHKMYRDMRVRADERFILSGFGLVGLTFLRFRLVRAVFT